MGKNLYVGNLAYSTSSEDLREAFEEFGEVSSAQVIMDRETGRSRGFGFVEMSSGAEAAVSALNGTELQGRTITVNEARPREERGGGGGGGGGGRGGGMAGPMTVTQKADSLVIERTMGENKVSSTYKLDGTESVNKQMGRGGEIETKSTAKWDGSKLTIVTKTPAQDGTVREATQTWSLEGGNLVIDSTRPGREGAPVTTKTVYKKTT
jgi:RNA recognition motif-containing protein